MDDNQLLTTALRLWDAGLCVLPAAPDGSKRPGVPWKAYQQERPTREQVQKWFTAWPTQELQHGLGVVTGAVSGDLEMLELEGRAVADGIGVEMTQLAEASGLGDLWRRVMTGYLETTPSGGVHLLYKVDGPVAKNTKLARRPGPVDEATGRPTIEVLAETRGEGGWVVLAPSSGPTHPSGKPWVLAAGGPATIPTISAEERDSLHHLATVFDRMPHPSEQTAAAAAPSSPLFSQPASGFDDDGSVSPGDDYNAKSTWDEILVPRGWTKLWTDTAGVTYWRRPGKKQGISATTGRNDGDNLYVWTTSTEFESERPYDRFGAVAHLEYGGDHSAAAKALQARGYGVRVEPTRPASPAPGPGPVVDGNLATVHQLAPRLQVVEKTYAQSDDGGALDLIEQFGTVIRYVPERGRWIAWDGTRWAFQPAGGGLVREYGKQVARGLPEDDKAAVSWKKKALSAQGTTNMLLQASTDVRVVVRFDDLDAHPMELNTPAGVVNLETGELGPADPARLHTKVTTCSPDPDADPGRWHEFLADTFGQDTELVAYLQRLVGYSATGSVAKHVLPFAVGSGGNGKGVFLESLIGVLGDYATTAPSGFLMAKNGTQHETEIARLAGMRMVVCSEVDEDARFDETKVKQLTGGDSLTARFMRQDHFTFQATHHLWLMGNHRPAVRSGGRSFWRRLRLIPFDHEVEPEKMVDDLQGILVREHGPALLAWIIQGAAQYVAGGLAEPSTVLAATSDYEADQDTVQRFVTECCHLASSDQVQIQGTKLREAYERWCFSEGESPVSAKRLTMELSRRFNVGQTRNSRARSYTGITLLTVDDSDPSSAPASAPHLSQPGMSHRDDRPGSDDQPYGGPGW